LDIWIISKIFYKFIYILFNKYFKYLSFLNLKISVFLNSKMIDI